ncbi:hypothetical protein KKA47_05420, partial [bacterium]|nr:hypothetical protein [bacterium]
AWVEAPKVCEIKVEKNGYDSKTTDKTVWDSLDSASMIIDLKKQPTFIDMHYMECTVPDELCGETTYICSPISRATEVKEYRCLDNDEYVAIKNILTWPAKKIERPKLEGQYYWLNKIRTIPGITLSVCNGDYDCMPGLICKRLFFDSSKPAVCMSNIYKEEEHDYIMSMEVQRRIADEMCSGMHPNGWAVPKYKHECDIGKSFGYSPNLDSLSTWQNWNKEFEFRCTSWTKIDFEEGLTTCAPAFCPYIPPPASPAGSTNIMFPKFKFNISKGTSEFLYGGCEVYSYGEEITQEFCTRTNAMELKMIPEYNLASLNAGVNNDTDKCDKYEGPMDSVNKLSDPTQHPSIYNPKFHYWWYWWQVRELDCYTDNNCPDDWGEHTTWKCEDNKCVEKIK